MENKKTAINIKECPIRHVLDRFGDKWSLLVIYILSNRFSPSKDHAMRFNELHKAIEGISQRMLTVTLRTLEADSLVDRKIYPVIPPKVEYRLSPLGISLVPLIAELASWAVKHRPQILKSREAYQHLLD